MRQNIRARSLAVIGSLLIVSGCGSSYYVQPAGVPLDEAYALRTEAARLSINSTKSPIYQQKKVPVLYPPRVFGCYAPSYIDEKRDVVVGEHWLFFKLSDATWFLEHENEEVEFETKDVRKPDKLIDVKLFFADNLARSIIPVRGE